MRGSHFREGYHDYEIVTGGVVVHPRLVAASITTDFTPEQCASGIANLDAMLGGGLDAGSTTLLLGPAGAGKSTVSMQFVVNALKAGKKAAVYIFDEVMHTLLERSEKLCLGKEGGIRVLRRRKAYCTSSRSIPPRCHPALLRTRCGARGSGAKVVVIDSLNGYLNAMPEERYLTTHLHELFAYLNQKGVLTIIVVAQHGMMASGAPPGDVDVSYLADTVLLFRYFEAGGEVKQAISVFKKRTGPHERTIRQLRIDETGFSVGEPLRQFRGIMTGVPQYEAAVVHEDRDRGDTAAHGPVMEAQHRPGRARAGADAQRARRRAHGTPAGRSERDLRSLSGRCRDLCRELRAGAGAVLLTDEILLADTDGSWSEALREQPAWSALPILVLAREGTGERMQQRRSGNLRQHGHRRAAGAYAIAGQRGPVGAARAAQSVPDPRRDPRARAASHGARPAGREATFCIVCGAVWAPGSSTFTPKRSTARTSARQTSAVRSTSRSPTPSCTKAFIPTIASGYTAAIANSLATKSLYDIEYRVVWPNRRNALGDGARARHLR